MAMRGWLRVALISAAAWVVGAAPAFAHHCDSIRNHIANVDRAMSQDTTASNRNYHINQRNALVNAYNACLQSHSGGGGGYSGGGYSGGGKAGAAIGLGLGILGILNDMNQQQEEQQGEELRRQQLLEMEEQSRREAEERERLRRETEEHERQRKEAEARAADARKRQAMANPWAPQESTAPAGAANPFGGPSAGASGPAKGANPFGAPQATANPFGCGPGPHPPDVRGCYDLTGGGKGTPQGAEGPQAGEAGKGDGSKKKALREAVRRRQAEREAGGPAEADAKKRQAMVNPWGAGEGAAPGAANPFGGPSAGASGPPKGHRREAMMGEELCKKWNGRYHTPAGSAVPVCDYPAKPDFQGASGGVTLEEGSKQTAEEWRRYLETGAQPEK